MKYPKRKQIPDRIKVHVTIRQNGLCECGCGVKMAPLGEGVDFDHHPPLAHRPINEDGTDYFPEQLDPDYIYAMRRPCHKDKTPDDTRIAAKIKRLKGETGTGPRQKIPQPKDPWKKKWRVKLKEEGRL